MYIIICSLIHEDAAHSFTSLVFYAILKQLWISEVRFRHFVNTTTVFYHAKASYGYVNACEVSPFLFPTAGHGSPHRMRGV